MAKKISNTDRYDATPEEVLDMMRDESYWPAKYAQLGASEFTLKEFTQDGDALHVQGRRVVPADLPSVAKKVIGDTNTVTQTEDWTPDGDGYVCDFAVAIANVPGGVTGWMRIDPVGEGQSDWSLEYTIKVGIPLIGGKLEGVLKDETRTNLDEEFAFNAKWLADA
jgi:Protein of unknown function (DUF2505)